MASPPLAVSYNWPDTGPGARARKRADVWQVSLFLRLAAARPLEPKGKLDAMTGYSFTTPVWDGGTWVTPVVAEVVAARRANGPEDQPRKQDAPAEWGKIDLAGARGAGTAAAAADLQGGAGAGLAQGQEPAEADAAEQVEHAGERAAGDAAQCWAQDRRDRRGGRADLRVQGGCGGARAPEYPDLETPGGQARVYSEGIKPCKIEAARNSGDFGQVPSSTGPQCTGARVGGPVRAKILWLPAGPQLSGRNRRYLRVRATARGSAGVASWMWIWQRRSTKSATTACYSAIGSFPARDMIRDWLKAGVFWNPARGLPQPGKERHKAA